jgi:hypothetical protein
MADWDLLVNEVFLRAIEAGSPAERVAVLEVSCQDNPDLRRKVEALLRAHDGAGSFLDRPAPGASGRPGRWGRPGRDPVSSGLGGRPPPAEDPVGHRHPAAQYRSAEMGIGIREGAAPSRPVGEAGSQGASPSPTHCGPLRSGAVLRLRGKQDSVMALVRVRSPWKAVRTPRLFGTGFARLLCQAK